MDSKKVIRERKRRRSKKSEKYGNLARIQWNKSRPEAIAQNTEEPTASAGSQQSNVDDIQDSMQSEMAVTHQDVSIDSTSNDRGIEAEAEAENVASTANYRSATGIPDFFDDETRGTIEKVVSELNRTDESSSVSDVNSAQSLLDDMHVGKNSSDSWDSDNSYSSSECQGGRIVQNTVQPH